MTVATHINKKTGMLVFASVQSWKNAKGEAVVSYRQCKNGELFGPGKTTSETKFNTLYREI